MILTWASYGDPGEGIVVLEARAFGYSVSLFDSSLEEGERRWGTLQKIKPSEDCETKRMLTMPVATLSAAFAFAASEPEPTTAERHPRSAAEERISLREGFVPRHMPSSTFFSTTLLLLLLLASHPHHYTVATTAASTSSSPASPAIAALVSAFELAVLRRARAQRGTWARHAGLHLDASPRERPVRDHRNGQEQRGAAPPSPPPPAHSTPRPSPPRPRPQHLRPGTPRGMLHDTDADIAGYLDRLATACSQQPASAPGWYDTCYGFLRSLVYDPRCTTRLDSGHCAAALRTRAPASASAPAPASVAAAAARRSTLGQPRRPVGTSWGVLR